LVDLQLDAQNSYLFAYNTFMQINKNFVHQVGDQPRLYRDARSTNHQILQISIKLLPKCFGVNTPSSGSLQVVLAKVMNY